MFNESRFFFSVALLVPAILRPSRNIIRDIRVGKIGGRQSVSTTRDVCLTREENANVNVTRVT